MEFFIAIFASLFTVVNPLGAVPVWLAMTPEYTKAERNRAALMTSIYFFLILISFYLAGTFILDFFGISLNAMRIAGGLIILSSGYALLSGKFAESRSVDKKVKKEALEKTDITFSPMAMPMLSGPGSISLLISLYAEHTSWDIRAVIALAIFATAVLVLTILRSAPYLFKLLGVGGIRAMSRIMGFLVMAIGIEYIIAGVVGLVDSLTNQ